MKGTGREGKCKRGCCWTPAGVCAKKGGCECHVRASQPGQSLMDYLKASGAKQRTMRNQDEINDRRTGDY